MRALLCVFSAAGCLLMHSMAAAAPLDAFLTANRPMSAGKGEIEASYDVVNDTVDVFGVREKSSYAGTRTGDYHGAHVRGGVAVTPRMWIDGGFWQRSIDYRSDTARMKTWQVGAQYRLIGEDAMQPAVAVRASAWGNYADDLNKSSVTSFQGMSLDSVRVDSPRDLQFQLDLIGTWPVRKDTELSAFLGGGKSRVRVDAITATTTRDGCRYNLSFGASETVGTLAQPCGTGSVVSFSVPNSVSGVNLNRETEYDADYLQAGFSAKWEREKWRLRLGYQYQVLRRDHVDDIISGRGGQSYDRNHVVLGEVAYRLGRSTSLFLRGQYMDNQFTGEIPFAYNSVTAHRFGQRYGFASAGLMVDF